MDSKVTTEMVEKFYGGEDPRDMPMYTIAEAARHIRTPYSTVYSWLKGRSYSGASGTKRSEPVISHSGGQLSFYVLVELHIIRGLRELRGISMATIRRSLDYARRDGWGTSFRELTRRNLKEDGGDLFIEYEGELISLSRGGQLALKEILEGYLKRVDLDDMDLPRRFYPFMPISEILGSDRKTVLIDPFVAFGRPVIANTGVPTSVVAQRYDAGESLEDLAWDYDIDAGQLRDAILYEQQQAA